MEGESSATSGYRLNYRLTATPPTAGVNPPSTCPITARLFGLYQECVDNGVWARVLYEARDRIEKLTFLKTAPPSHQPGQRPASDRRRARDKRRREAWAQKRRIRSQACPLLCGVEGEEATAVAAPTTAAAPAQAVNASPLCQLYAYTSGSSVEACKNSDGSRPLQ
jgi:hypothetical protein